MIAFCIALFSALMHTGCVLVACGSELVSKHCALRPQKRGGLLGTETGVGGGWVSGGRKSEGSAARTDPKNRGGRGQQPEQPMLRQCFLAIA